jgi:cytidine deaminase
MAICKISATLLSHDEILAWLRELRANAYTAQSGFAVSAIMRANIGENFYYFAGVNVENITYNLNLCAEDSALAALKTMGGKDVAIEEIWTMGAPRGLQPGSADPAADRCISCCGRCRQQIIKLAKPEVQVHAVSLNGRWQTTTVGTFLPDHFSYREPTPKAIAAVDANPPPVEALVVHRAIRQGKELLPGEIRQWLSELGANLAGAAVIRLAKNWYVAGMQAGKRISPIQAAIAIATTAFGHPAVQTLYSYAHIAQGYILPDGADVQTLCQFSIPDMRVCLFNKTPLPTFTQLSTFNATTFARHIQDARSQTERRGLS